ncbi:glutamate--cysteine ligase [Arhodomonas sp. AD133]|uniref:glutamate--cysteine ligase n=1 Tax=Arhodomonas sp. AD133 TaxID=3415009 RepID=UPI003EBDAEA7
MTPPDGSQPVTGRDDLVAWIEAGSKAPADWRIGTEHEKFVFDRRTLEPVGFDGPRGIEAFLEGMTRFGWTPVTEAGRTIALKRDGAAITLEPAGQLELSGAPLERLQQSCAEVNGHLAEVREVASELDVGLLGVGFHPTARREAMPWMPKARYAIMRRYMPTRGDHGLDMMTRSCGVQVNLDFADEADMVRKLRVGLALQPLATALFANSPFVEGSPSGWQSYRSRVWMDTDPDRCGMLAFAFGDDMGFERYVDYALDVPMYFIHRGERLIDAAGQSFRDFMAGRLPALPGEYPTLADWEDHLTTLFPEVRIKRFIEMRGADAGPWERLCALPAFWTGLLYDRRALDQAYQLIADWQPGELAALRADAARHGLAARFRGETLTDWARRVLPIARQGLAHRGWGEAHFLDSLEAIAATGRTPSDEQLEAYHGRWHGDVRAVFREYAY